MGKYLYIVFLSMLVFSGCIKPTDPADTGGDNAGYEIAGKYMTKGYAQDVVIQGSLAYIAQGQGGLTIIDVSDPNNPTEASTIYQELRGYSSKIAFKSNSVYLAAGSYGVAVVDVTSAEYPVVISTNLEMKPAKNFLVYSDFLFTGISEQGIRIADITTSSFPDIKGRIKSVPGYSQAMAITADKMMLVACGEMGLSLVDMAELETGFESFGLSGWIDTPGYAEDVTSKEGSKYALMACGTFGLIIVDFSDMADLKIISSFDPGGYAKELICRGNTVYMTTETRGLKIISIADINSPKLLGTVETKYAMGIDADDNYLYIADRLEGLITVKIP